MDTESCAALSFLLSPNIGPKTFAALLKQFGTANDAFFAPKTELKSLLGEKTLHDFIAFRTSFEVKEYEQELIHADVTFISQCDKQYPQQLFKLENPPIGVFTKGNIELLCSSFIAVVGTRKTTSYGRQITETIVGELVDAGSTIISGLALGIDAIAHKTTIEHKGSTIAVLGCGVDCPNPPTNARLYQEILENNGLIISEYPLSVSPNPGTFPARNRLIASLSQATLVTEAAADSGSLITADWAQKLNKKVFAIPGPITSKQSDGTAYLLKRGAKFVTEASDILEELNFKTVRNSDKKDWSNLLVSGQELAIIKLLENEPLSVDTIAKQTKIPIFKLNPLLSSLELRGVIKNQGNKTFGIA